MLDLSIATVLGTFGVVFLVELPDKTAMAALVLGTRFKTREVILGIWAAFLIQTAVAAIAGSLLHLLPTEPVHIVSGLGFLIFAFLAFRENLRKELREEKEIVKEEAHIYKSGLLTSFLVVFAAEWGDLSQLATAGLVASSKSPLSVVIGAVVALWTVTVIAAVAGAKLSDVLPKEKINLVSGVLFALIGLVIIATAIFQ